MIKKPGTWISLFFVVLALVSGYFYLTGINKQVLPENIIFKASNRFKSDLKSFLNSAGSTYDKLNTEIKYTNVDELPVDSLNRYFSNLIGKKTLLFGVLLFGDNMNYVVFRDQDSWVYTYNNLLDTIINWQRIDQNLKPVPNGNWTETYNNFMDESNFGTVKIKVAHLTKGECMWRAAKSTLPNKNDLLFNVFQLITENDTSIAALIYKTSEIDNRFSKILLFENPLISIITEDGDIVSPVTTKDSTTISKYKKLESYVIGNVDLWKKKNNEEPHTYSFAEFNRNYFTRIDTISPELAIKAYAITVSEDELINAKKRVDQAYLYAVLLFLLFALFAYLNTFNRYKKRKNIFGGDLKQLPESEIKNLISKGETEYVEFKSSIRWDFKEEKVNNLLEKVIMKSIAAFANAKGGILIIGVNDDKEIIGLEPDFKTLKKQTADYFELHLRKMINNNFSIRFSNKHILMQFPVFNSKTICVLQVLPGTSALFMKTKNKEGQMIEKFYVRTGNASQEIGSLTELQEYIKERFNSKN